MATSVERASAAAVDLAWSLWRELGVPGAVRRHNDWAVVPEPLILFTGALRDHDRRLRDQAVAWSIEYLPLVSTSALHNTYTRERWPIDVIADFATTMAEATGARWVGRDVGSAFPVSATIKSVKAPLNDPSAVVLRIRSAFGVGARAEVLRSLLLSYPAEPTMTELAAAAFATKRHTADAVKHLEWGGVVHLDRRHQPFRIRLRKADELVRLVRPVPRYTADWGPSLRLIAGAVAALTDISSLPNDVAAPELHRRLRHLDDQMLRSRLDQPRSSDGAYLEATSEWLVDVIESLAAGTNAGPLTTAIHLGDGVNA